MSGWQGPYEGCPNALPVHTQLGNLGQAIDESWYNRNKEDIK